MSEEIQLLRERVSALEQIVQKLKSRIAPRPRGDWLDHVIGSVTDVVGFKEVLRLGREYRVSDRAADEGSNQP